MTEFIVKLPLNDSVTCQVYLLQYKCVSNSLWKRIKHSGTLKINGAQVHATRAIVKDGDLISYDILKPTNIVAEDIPLDIIYEDESLLVINKPAGMLVHPTTRESLGTLANVVLGYYAKNNLKLAYHPCHRLDRQTSGLVLIAKQPEIHYLLAKNNATQRKYLALSTGIINPPQGTIDAPIARALPSIILRKVALEGKPAITHYRVLGYTTSFSLVQLKLDTGRTHQIRVHMSSIGHTLLGDALYDGDTSLISRQALHCRSLRLIHPLTKKELTLSAPIPDDMAKLITKITVDTEYF